MIDFKSLKPIIIKCDRYECTKTIEVKTVLYCRNIVPKFTDIQAAKWQKLPSMNRHYCPAHHLED